MTALFEAAIAPGRIHLPTDAAFEAYWSRCEAAIAFAAVIELARLPTNDERADYFRSARDYAARALAGESQSRRFAYLARLRRMVHEALRCEGGAAAPAASEPAEQMEIFA